MKKIFLASVSPRRRRLLAELGWNFEVTPSSYEEIPGKNESAEDMSLRFALGKALNIAKEYKDAIVIGADTAVVVDGEVLGKPKNESEASDMLAKLAGRTHEVVTAVAVVSPDKEPLTAIEKTKVTFRPLDKTEIAAYISTGESMDKAGAYAIQGHGMLLVKSIEGCYFNVVGLPVERLSSMLGELGITLIEQWGS